jgi:sugar phosphate isomerase/epimerase
MAFRYTGFADEAGKSLDEQISVVKEAGWKSIELRSLDIGHTCDLSDAQWDEVWGRLQAAGIAVAGFGGQIANWARPVTSDFQKDVDELKRAAPRMKQCGTNLIRVMSYPNDKEKPLGDAEWKQEAFRRLKELARIAEDLGVVLGHENCNGYGSIGPAQYREMIDTVNSPALKSIFDTGNTSLHDNDLEATWRFYEACIDDIVHVHIKSARPGPEGKLVTCYPDEDPMQARVLADLKKRGYDGWVSIEPHLHAQIHAGTEAKDPDAARKAWVDYAKRLEKLVAGL